MQDALNTNRLIIKKLSLTDTAFILELVNTPDWLIFIGDRKVSSLEDANLYIQKILDNHNVTYWVVELINQQIPIGVISLIKRDYLENKDLGFAFLPAFAKMGFAFEAIQCVLENLKMQEQSITMDAITIPENMKSIQLLTKLGFHFQKEIQVESEILHLYTFQIL